MGAEYCDVSDRYLYICIFPPGHRAQRCSRLSLAEHPQTVTVSLGPASQASSIYLPAPAFGPADTPPLLAAARRARESRDRELSSELTLGERTSCVVTCESERGVTSIHHHQGIY